MPDSDDDLYVTLIATFWHPRFGLVLWHTNERDDPFVMWVRGLPEAGAQRASRAYVAELNAPTLGDHDLHLN